MKWLLRVLGYAISGLVMLAGGIALSEVVRSVFGARVVDPVSKVIVGLSLVAFGYSGVRYLQLNYRGGASSILGGFFLVAGIWTIVHNVEASNFIFTRDTVLDVVVGALLLYGGYLLLRAGHERHRRLSS